jgi:hypothetical protein
VYLPLAALAVVRFYVLLIIISMGIVEVRQYTLVPSKSKEFFALTNDYGSLRKELMPVKGYALDSFLWCIVYLYLYLSDTTRTD